MQWLIDLIIEAIGIPPVFIDRGDPVNPDYAIGDLTGDNAWNDLDLSAIVPENAKGVLLGVWVKTTGLDFAIDFRKKGNVNTANRAAVYSQVVLSFHSQNVVVALDDNRVIQYKFAAAAFITINLHIRAWWF